MLLKIYLGISILTLITLILVNLSTVRRAKNKYGEQLDAIETKSDLAGSILAWLRIVIVSFIPILNIIMLVGIIFMSDKITASADETVENALRNANKKEKY